MELSLTLIIIIVTALVSIGGFSSHKTIDDLIFYPPAVSEQKQWYRFFSCGLIHADWGHLIFNMLALYLFGRNVESYFLQIFGTTGKVIYLVMYISGLAVSVLPTYFKHKHDYGYRSLGASGAVSAVIFASILFNPLAGIGMMFIPIYVAGFIFGILYLVISNYLERKGGSNINHSAHIYGALYGVGFTIVAAQLFSTYPVLQAFLSQITNASPSDFIQFGR